MFDLLEAMESYQDRMGWHLNSGRHYRRRDMEKAARMGLAESARCVVCDDDGFTKEPEREREGWTITPLGRKWLKVARANLLEGGYPRWNDQQILTLAQAEA
jgi:hypothetical protein